MGRYRFKKEDIQRIEDIISKIEKLENERLDSYSISRDYYKTTIKYEMNLREDILSKSGNLVELQQSMNKIRNFKQSDFTENDVDATYFDQHRAELKDLKKDLYFLNKLLVNKRNPDRWIILVFIWSSYLVMFQDYDGYYGNLFAGCLLNLSAVILWLWKGPH